MGTRAAVGAILLTLLAYPHAASASWTRAVEGVECVLPPKSPLGYGVTAIRADQVVPPSTTPPIAILDTGIAQAPEFAGRIRPGINVTSGSAPTPDNDGHGTAVASVAAASSETLRGVSPSSPIIPIKIFSVRGEASAAWVVRGLREAVRRGAKVINLSASGLPSATASAADRAVMTAIGEAVSSGAVVVAPSGNEGAGQLDVPAAYPHVLAVGATSESGLLASFSNTGSGLDLVAPGERVVAAAPTFLCSSGYLAASGTSFSAPAVSGAVAQLAALRPTLDASQLADMVRLRAARAEVTDWSLQLGFGLLDLPSVLAAPTPQPQPREVDDDVYWARSKRPSLSSVHRSATITGTVTTRFDPADVFRLNLKSGDRLKAKVAPSLGLSLWGGTTSPFAIGSGDTRTLVARTIPARGVQIRSTGTYYLALKPGRRDFAGRDYVLKLARR